MGPSVLINIDVDDIDAAESFYGRAFGLTVGRRLGPEVVELLGADAPIYLLAKPGGSAATGAPGPRRDYRRHWTPVHLDFVVEELDAALARALDAGATQEGAIRDHDWGRIAQIADPFGHGICLLQFKGRGYDELVAE